jgi:HEAT repeat protein
MNFPKFFFILTTVFFLAACDSELRKAETLYQQSQSLHLKEASTFTDPLGEAIRILESYLARNPDEPRATLLLWRCYLQAGHPRAQALGDNMREIPEAMRRIFPAAIRRELDSIMRERMVCLFGEIATPAEAKALIKILERDNATNVQRAAADVLARINAAAAVQPLLRKLPASQPAVRLYACRALSSFPHPEVTQALVSRLQDFQEVPEVRQQAAQSLAQMCQRQFEGKTILLQQLEQLQRDEAYPLLTRLLVASTLAALGQTTGHDLAMACATSTDPFMRGVAIITLGYIGDHQALPHLTDALANGNKALRLQAAEALGRLGNAKALPSLYKAMDDPSEAVRAAANQAISKIKTSGKNG